MDTIYKSNYFKENHSFNSYEIINLLGKLSNRRIRNLVTEFNFVKEENSERSKLLYFLLNQICKGLLKKYGSLILSFILDLPIIKNLNQNYHIFNLSKNEYIREYINDGYTSKFATYSINSSYLFSFDFSNYINKPSMIICNYSGFLLGRINENGQIDENFISRLNFNIFEFFDNSHIEFYDYGIILNSKCANYRCRRELTNPESIYYGIGPVCRENYDHLLFL